MASDDSKQYTIDTYNKSSVKLAEYFNGIGSKKEDISLVSCFIPLENPNVLEIGCGDGREAAEIAEITDNYLGVDISEGMIDLARERFPGMIFKVADLEGYRFEELVDAVFSFATFLHLPKEEFAQALEVVHKGLNAGGVLYLTLKARDSYQEEIKEDDFGKRMFYYYTHDDVTELMGDMFEELYYDDQQIGSTDWMSILVRKQ